MISLKRMPALQPDFMRVGTIPASSGWPGGFEIAFVRNAFNLVAGKF